MTLVTLCKPRGNSITTRERRFRALIKPETRIYITLPQIRPSNRVSQSSVIICGLNNSHGQTSGGSLVDVESQTMLLL